MEMYIDTANLEEIKEALSWGIVSGITTNPSLIKQEVVEERTQNLDDHIKLILEAAEKRPVSLEVTETKLAGILREAGVLIERYGGSGTVVVKVPINPAQSPEEKTQYDGLKAIYQLAKKDIAVNTTLVMTPEQALLAARAGAAYVSPFAGRIDDLLSEKSKGEGSGKSDYYPQEGKEDKVEDNGIVSGVHLVGSIVTMFGNYPAITTKVLAASVRNARQARELATVGADIATLPFYVLDAMIRHPKTYEGAVKFKQDVVAEYAELLSRSN